MRTGTAIAVITATLIAVVATLGIAGMGTQTRIPDRFLSITYTRNVEHDQKAVFGECPLGQQVVVDGKGHAEVIWYVQNALHHGCSRALNIASDGDDQAYWDEPVIARQQLRLRPADLQRLLSDLDRLRWLPDWQPLGAEPTSVAVGCDRQSTYSLADRYIFVEAAIDRYALLAIYGEKAGNFGSPACAANEIANADTLDAAFAPFVQSMPFRYSLSQEVAARLYREP
ncbi:MAG TPA: hypothetical protein PKD99_16810 [Sphingopyxis sp.]|nr:hypothetical protein [Sphingopyxis sp.]HMP46763.1 hypothetical protein [Sphingopyxis sp.]HMQ18980.1 hypothetical protein [Sphingopyxis sp.]